MTREDRDGESRFVDRLRNIMNDERRFFETISTSILSKKVPPYEVIKFHAASLEKHASFSHGGCLRQGVRNVVRLAERYRSDRESRENPQLTPCMTWHPLSREIDVISRGCERIVPVNGSTCRRVTPSFFDPFSIFQRFMILFFFLLPSSSSKWQSYRL